VSEIELTGVSNWPTLAMHDLRKENALKRLAQAATLALLSMQLLAVPTFAAPAAEPAVAPAQAPDPAPAPALRAISTNLQDDIFLNGADLLPAPQQKAYWGRCSQSCAPCWSATGCPRDDDGSFQSCLHFCP
jgi:hypothetical protein